MSIITLLEPVIVRIKSGEAFVTWSWRDKAQIICFLLVFGYIHCTQCTLEVLSLYVASHACPSGCSWQLWWQERGEKGLPKSELRWCWWDFPLSWCCLEYLLVIGDQMRLVWEVLIHRLWCPWCHVSRYQSLWHVVGVKTDPPLLCTHLLSVEGTLPVTWSWGFCRTATGGSSLPRWQETSDILCT